MAGETPKRSSMTDALYVIKAFIQELRADFNEAALDHNARALAARLAQHEPPLLICYPSEIKD